MAFVRQCDKLTEALYAELVGCCSKAILYVCSACQRKGSIAKRLQQDEVEMARAENEQLASERELEECNHTLIELQREKQRLVEHNVELEEEVARFADKLVKVSVKSATGRVTKQEAHDLPELESLTYHWVFLR